MHTHTEVIATIIALARKYGATRLILFGSYARAPAEAHDIDLACEGIQGWKLYEFAGQLENELRIPLDIFPLSPPTPFTHRIEREGNVLL
jgi:predicted nucleotidyltransferase